MLKLLMIGGDGNINSFINGFIWIIEQNPHILLIPLMIPFISKEINNLIEYAYSKNICIISPYDELSFMSKSDKILSSSFNRINKKNNIIFDDISFPVYNNYIERIKGSSFSSSILAGILSLIIQRNHSYKNEEVYSFIKRHFSMENKGLFSS